MALVKHKRVANKIYMGRTDRKNFTIRLRSGTRP